jgi:drug/metabolite transporter (DMT)-like permease
MSTSSLDPEKTTPKKQMMSDKAYGTLLCILSDTLFSIVYVFVQFINKNTFNQDAIFNPSWRGDWILCFKEWIAAMFALPIFIYLWRTGKTSIPGWKVIIGLIIAAFFCEYIGIGHHVLANDYIGMALGLPVIRTITILGCAIFGALLLRERVTGLKMAMIAVLICAVAMFGYSNSLAKKAKDAANAAAPAAVAVEDAQAQAVEVQESEVPVEPEVVAEAAEPAEPEVKAEVKAEAETEKKIMYAGYAVPFDARTFGFICAFITGMGYAIYTLILRAVMKKPELKEGQEAPKPVSAYFVVSMVFGFGGLFGFIAMLGKMRAAETPLNLGDLATVVPMACWLNILAAGVLTFIAFYLKNLSYRYASASKAAAMSVLQVLLNICAGMLIFSEAASWNGTIYAVFTVGTVLTILGIILASRTS